MAVSVGVRVAVGVGVQVRVAVGVGVTVLAAEHLTPVRCSRDMPASQAWKTGLGGSQSWVSLN